VNKEISVEDKEVVFSIQKKLYPLEIVQGAAYILTDRAVAYVEEEEDEWVLTLESKEGSPDEASLETLAGDFVNEVLNQTIRQRLLASNRSIMELVLSRAFVSARRDDGDPDQPPEASDASLSDEQRAEMEKLIAEAEAEVEKLKSGESDAAVLDSWEKKHGKSRTGG